MKRQNTVKELAWFFALTLTIMYAFCFLVVLFHDQINAFSARHLGGLDANLLLYPAAYSPTLSAIVLTAAFGRWAGLKRLFADVFRWRVGARWWLVSFLAFPAVWLAVAIVLHVSKHEPIHWDVWFQKAPLLLLAGYIFTDTGGLGEETGWRGFALPRLLERFNPVAAGLIVGLFFGLWHIPGWFLSNLHFSELDFGCFLGFTMLMSVVMAYFYISMKGSVLLAGIIPHMMMNVGSDGMYKNNWEYFGYFAIFTVILVALNFRKLYLAAPPFNPAYSPQYYGGRSDDLASPHAVLK
jgi:membrane protease YdiL (CAAX protease family)